MAHAANESCFSQPHWRVIAQGFRTEDWFDRGQAVGTGGILQPRPVRLTVGHAYYRFASSASPRSAQLGGGWWLDFENFKQIEAFASANGYSIRDAARLLLALPYAWTKVDLRVRAVLCIPL